MGVDTRAGVVGTTCSSLRPEGRKADPLSRFAASGDWLSAVANPAPAPYTRADTSAKGAACLGPAIQFSARSGGVLPSCEGGPGEASASRRGLRPARPDACSWRARRRRGSVPSWRRRRSPRRPRAGHGARVVIVGAGLAGLTCAYRLRQHGIHADVFEARTDRLGGRCWTVRIFANGQVAEHGGEFIDTRHVQTLRIVRELGLSLEDREAHGPPSDAIRPLWLNGRLRDPAAVYAGVDQL